MYVRYSAKLQEEKSQIVLLCESGKLGGVVESDINEFPDSFSSQGGEELARTLLGEPDGEDLHSVLRPGLRPKATGGARRIRNSFFLQFIGPIDNSFGIKKELPLGQTMLL